MFKILAKIFAHFFSSSKGYTVRIVLRMDCLGFLYCLSCLDCLVCLQVDSWTAWNFWAACLD
jgi:hypothetical protein